MAVVKSVPLAEAIAFSSAWRVVWRVAWSVFKVFLAACTPVLLVMAVWIAWLSFRIVEAWLNSSVRSVFSSALSLVWSAWTAVGEVVEGVEPVEVVVGVAG